MKPIRLEVCPQKGEWPWKVTVSGKTEYHEATQSLAINKALRRAACLVKNGYTVRLNIKRPDGTIRDERTYPRSSDPRRTKG